MEKKLEKQTNPNMRYYEEFRKVPQEAQKVIVGGRLKGFTDINPMWRIKMLTETFGVAGIGWYTEIVNQFLETGANGEMTAHVTINLFVKIDGEWSKPIIGVGGSMFVAKEKTGLYTSDEAFKMAYTDAISIACKALGMGADIYYAKDRTKYDLQDNPQSQPDNPQINVDVVKEQIKNAKTLEELSQIWYDKKNKSIQIEIRELIANRNREINKR